MTPTRSPRLSSLSICLFAFVLGAAACASESEGTGTGGSGPGGSGPGGSSAGAPGGGGVPGVAGSGPAGAPGIAGSAPAGSGGSAAGAGGSAAGTGGSTGLAGAAAGSGGSGAGGSSAGGATAGRGGSTSGGAGGASAGRGGSAAGGSSAGGAPAGGSTGTTGCPSNMTFCSGFEDSAQPANSVFKLQGAPSAWTVNFAVDTTVKHAGNSSLRVKTASDGAMGQYRMLAVPGTQGAFWVRFWLRSDIDLAGDHNAFVMASLDDEANNSNSIEFGEDVGIAFNTSDDVRWPTGYGRLTSGGTNPYKLAKDTWHCVEISFDGTGRTQQLFVNGAQLINATSYPKDPKAIKIFKFGFQSFHGPDRHMWYDDVAVAPTRIGGCN